MVFLSQCFNHVSIKTKRQLYRAICKKFERYHSILDPCGFKTLDNGRCWHGIPCCHSVEFVNIYLSPDVQFIH